MARSKDTPLAPAQGEGLSPEAQMQVVAAQASALTDAQNDEILAAGMDLGRLEALDFVATIATTAKLAIYENVKKSKAWRFLRNTGSGDGRHFESLDEFCEVKLGQSYRRLRELTLNRNTIGQEAFEQAERIGLRQVDFNAIKALPAPDQELISQALRAEATKDEVLNTLQELAARHAKEKEALLKDMREVEAERQADKDLLETKNKRIDKLEKEVRRIEKLEPDEALALVQKEAASHCMDALGLIRGQFRLSLKTLAEHKAEPIYMAGLVGQLVAELHVVREEFGLPDLSDAEDKQLADEVAQWAGN